jgi:reverse gyrase
MFIPWFCMVRPSCDTTIVRRIEDKLDSRQLASQLISLRMDAPPSSKRVAMTMFGWIVWQEDNLQNNMFKDCQLLQDRLGQTWAKQSCKSILVSL